MASAVASLDPTVLDPGTNVLVSGPVMTSKQQLLFRLLARPDPFTRGTVVVTTRKSADAVAQGFRSVAGEVPDERLSIVDCTGVQGLSSRSRSRPNRRQVGNPGDLTGIGMRLTAFMRQYHSRGETARVGIHSLSTMLMYTELRRLFQFLHVVTSRVDSSGFVGVYAVDDSALGPRERDILLQLFDTVVETRDTDTGRQLRVRGDHADSLGPRQWSTY
jgi:hypothetical protein